MPILERQRSHNLRMLLPFHGNTEPEKLGKDTVLGVGDIHDALVPLFIFSHEYVKTHGGSFFVKGSTVRHAVLNELANPLFPVDARSSRFNINKFLQKQVMSKEADEFQDLRAKKPEIAAVYLDLLGGQHFDILIDGPTTTLDNFYSAGLPAFVQFFTNPIMIADFAGNYSQNAGLITELARTPIMDADDRQKSEIVSLDPTCRYASRVKGVSIHTPSFETVSPLLVMLREFKREGGVQVARVSLAADLREDTTQPLRPADTHHVISVDFSRKLPKDQAKIYNNRQGTGSDKNALAQLSIPLHRDTSFLSSLNIDLLPQSYEVLTKPVALMEGWNNEQKPVGNRLEIATRAIWQAIDTQLNAPGRGTYITEETQKEIATNLESISVSEWAHIPEGTKTLIQKNLLMSLIAAPEQALWYFRTSGIWKIISQGKNIPDFEAIMAYVQQNYDKYRYKYMILFPDRDYGNARFTQNGWELLSRACYPNIPENGILEQIYHLTRIGV